MSLISKADKAAAALKGVVVTGSKKKRTEVEIEGLEDYVILDSLIKTLEAVKETYSEPVKEQAKTEFLKSDGNKRPGSFTGKEGDAEANIQLRKRSSKSTLSEDETTALAKAGVPYDTIDDVPEAYAINPKYLSDSALLGRIEKVKGLPDDFIIKQEAQSRNVVSDETIDTVFRKGLAEELIDVVGTLAIKGKLNTADAKKTLAFVNKIVGHKN